MTQSIGPHFLQIPGPTNVPDRVLRALAQPTIDHRGPDFPALTREILAGLGPIFNTKGPIPIFPSSGGGGWEAAMVNALSPGDKVLMFETGFFALQWAETARKLGFEVEMVPGDWRTGIKAPEAAARLAEDTSHSYKAVCMVHCETSTGVLSDIPALRRAIDETGHPALLMVDAISSLGTVEYLHDDWGVDVTISASQKGLMLPPGLGLQALSDKALSAAKKSTFPRRYWDWQAVMAANEEGSFPYTPATNLLYGLKESLAMLAEEGLGQVYARHERHSRAAMAAARAWGLTPCPAKAEEYSPGLTTLFVPEGFDSDELRQLILSRFNMALGTGLGRVKGKVFRIGHLGWFNDLMLAGALAGVEMGLEVAKIPHHKGGVQAALEVLAGE